MELNIDLNILEVEPAEEYHAKADRYLSSHQLMDFMQVPLAVPQEGSRADRGQGPPGLPGRPGRPLPHPRRARRLRDAVRPRRARSIPRPASPSARTPRPSPSGPRPRASRSSTHDQVELIEQMASGVAMNDEAVDLLLYGRSEGVVRAEYCGTPCQIRIDWTHPHRGIVDLKTTRRPDLVRGRRPAATATTTRWRSTGPSWPRSIGQLVPVHIIAVEKKEPFRCGVWRVSDDTLAIAQRRRTRRPSGGCWPAASRTSGPPATRRSACWTSHEHLPRPGGTLSAGMPPKRRPTPCRPAHLGRAGLTGAS